MLIVSSLSMFLLIHVIISVPIPCDAIVFDVTAMAYRW